MQGEAHDTTVHGAGVLSNLDMLERAGFSTVPFLEALGETRESLVAGARVEWDRFAPLLEKAMETVGAVRLDEITRELASVLSEVSPALVGITTQRGALDVMFRAIVPIVWTPIRFAYGNLGIGLAVARVEIPEPLYCPRDYLQMHIGAFETFPHHARLPPVRVLDVEVSRDGRRATYFIELTDEHVRAPLGPLGDAIRGQAVVSMLDIAELARVDPAAWVARHGLDRGALMAGALVPWDALRELADLIEASAGPDGFASASRSLASLTRDVGSTVDPHRDLAALYASLHGEAVFSFWGAIGPAIIETIRPGVLYVRCHVRDGLPGCSSLWRSHAGTLEGLPAHHDLPPARVRSMHLDADGTAATYVLDLPREVGRSEERAGLALELPRDDAHAASNIELVDRISVEASRSRQAARTGIVERLGRELATTRDVHAIADALLETVMGTLALDGMQIDLATGPGGALVPLRTRGATQGDALVRTLRHGGDEVGQLLAWTRAETTGETLAALDLLTPWIAVALGTAIQVAREKHARVAAEARTEGTEQALDETLSLHPSAAYVLTDEGRVTAANERAASALRADPRGTLARIARAVGEADRASFDILPVRIAGRIDRILVIERASQEPFEHRVRAAAEKWALTGRQLEVLESVARGMSNKEIAGALGCAEVTVETHLTSIYRKAAVDGRSRLVAKLSSLGRPQ